MAMTMFKVDHKKKLYIHGDLNAREIRELKKEGWRVDVKAKPSISSKTVNKNGIPREGDTSCQSANDATSRSRRQEVSKSGSARSARGNTTKQKRSS